jgi:hypothetical protein
VLAPRALGIAFVALCAASMPATAGPHANAALIMHLNPQIEYTSSVTSYAGQSDLRDCREAITQGQVLGDAAAQVWFVIASFAKSPGPVNVGGIEFGFGSYKAGNVDFVAAGPCGDDWIEIPTSHWPGPREGVAMALGPDVGLRADPLEVYWFAAYVYGPVTIELGPNPMSGLVGIAAKEDPVPDAEEVYDLGSLGFGLDHPGFNPCNPNVRGACCAFGDCRLVSESECQGLGGAFKGAGTDCFPNPCGVPIETTWGTLKKLYD